MPNRKIGIIGAGPVGSIMAAYLARNGENVYLIDINTGEMKMVAENPGNIMGWITDNDGKLRVAMTTDGVNNSILYRETENDPFKPVVTMCCKASSVRGHMPLVYSISRPPWQPSKGWLEVPKVFFPARASIHKKMGSPMYPAPAPTPSVTATILRPVTSNTSSRAGAPSGTASAISASPTNGFRHSESASRAGGPSASAIDVASKKIQMGFV